jgi:F-type H+-transporting ATPase subunit delta
MSANKSFSTETSERYSRALFEVAQEANELEKIENDIKNFASVLNNSLEIKNFIHNPKNFMFLLIEKRRIFFVEKIIDSFLKLCAQKRGEVKASLISSKELSETELENISKELSSSTSSTIKLNYKVDKELIGGLKLQLGSFMIDTSIKNKLNKYKQAMLES